MCHAAVGCCYYDTFREANWQGESGCMMFADNTFLIDEGVQDYQVLATYLTQKLGGVVEEKYAQTEGRITVK